MGEFSAESAVQSQKHFFQENLTFPIAFRKQQLRKLRSLIQANENEISAALFNDLGKSAFESYATEIGIVLEEISFHIKNLNSWAKKKKVSTPITAFPAKSYIQPEPYGVVLIVAPWNYPFQLALAPLVGAISAGNCCIVKPSEISSNTAQLLEKLINSNFDERYIRIITGGVNVSQELLKQAFDLIFFTGSPRVGKIVMRAAAENLTPVVLELGGKSPCIVDKDVDVALTAKRIMWGKCINAGQTCIAPDYVLVHEAIKDKLFEQLSKSIQDLYGKNPQQSIDYPRIINKEHVLRLEQMLSAGRIVAGGNFDLNNRYFEPTIVDVQDTEHKLMQEEIFGPILPVVTYSKLAEAIRFVQNKPKPLALYLFTNNKQNLQQLLSQLSAGGVTVNDTIMHFANNKLPFGGVGNSGLGSYHGHASFSAFSHFKSVMKRASWLDIPLRYPPFANKLKIVKFLIK